MHIWLAVQRQICYLKSYCLHDNNAIFIQIYVSLWIVEKEYFSYKEIQRDSENIDSVSKIDLCASVNAY